MEVVTATFDRKALVSFLNKVTKLTTSVPLEIDDKGILRTKYATLDHVGMVEGGIESKECDGSADVFSVLGEKILKGAERVTGDDAQIIVIPKENKVMVKGSKAGTKNIAMVTEVKTQISLRVIKDFEPKDGKFLAIVKPKDLKVIAKDISEAPDKSASQLSFMFKPDELITTTGIYEEDGDSWDRELPTEEYNFKEEYLAMYPSEYFFNMFPLLEGNVYLHIPEKDFPILIKDSTGKEGSRSTVYFAVAPRTIEEDDPEPEPTPEPEVEDPEETAMEEEVKEDSKKKKSKKGTSVKEVLSKKDEPEEESKPVEELDI